MCERIYDMKEKNKRFQYECYQIMLSYCLKCRRNTESKNANVV